MQNFGTSLAPTRERGTSTTQSVRSTRPWRTVTFSPGLTSRAGLAGRSLIATEPALHASVAKLRVLKMRTAHNHLSRRAAVSRGGALNAKKTKTVATVVKRATVENLRKDHRLSSNQRRGIRSNSLRSQSSSSAFSCRVGSFRNPIVIFIINERSRSSRSPCATTFPSGSVIRKARTIRGG